MHHPMETCLMGLSPPGGGRFQSCATLPEVMGVAVNHRLAGNKQYHTLDLLGLPLVLPLNGVKFQQG
jgi:hypothetical protein